MIEVVVPGPPPRKNERHKIVLRPQGAKCRSCGRQRQFPTRANTKAFYAFCDALRVEWADRMHERIERGEWEIEVRSYWAQLSHHDCPHNCGSKKRTCIGIGRGDVDASIETVLDALQEIGALDNDVRFTRALLDKYHDADNPRTEITLTKTESEMTLI